jgi:hypothetical protein
MTKTQLVYRGVSYDGTQHAELPAQPVEHVYRGVHYREALRHEPTQPDEALELHYRGHAYHHRRAEAARQVNAG